MPEARRRSPRRARAGAARRSSSCVSRWGFEDALGAQDRRCCGKERINIARALRSESRNRLRGTRSAGFFVLARAAAPAISVTVSRGGCMATPARSPLPGAIAGTYHHRPPHRWSTALALRAWGVALLLAAGCRDQGPSTGNVRVTVTTTGGDLDLDGYALTVDGAGQQSIAVSGTMLLPDLPTGPHDVELIGVAANCTVAGPNPRLVAVRGGAVVEVSFAVSWVATGVQVTTPTTGLETEPDGYSVAVDGGTPQAIVVNGSATITRLSAGSHTVVLSGVAANCAVTGSASRSVSIASGQTVPVIFDVTCLATTGNIEVTAATAGIDVDADGYTVQVDAGAAQALAINGTARFEGLGAGDHSVTLAGAAGNCSVAGSNPRALS